MGTAVEVEVVATAGVEVVVNMEDGVLIVVDLDGRALLSDDETPEKGPTFAGPRHAR